MRSGSTRCIRLIVQIKLLKFLTYVWPVSLERLYLDIRIAKAANSALPILQSKIGNRGYKEEHLRTSNRGSLHRANNYGDTYQLE